MGASAGRGDPGPPFYEGIVGHRSASKEVSPSSLWTPSSAPMVPLLLAGIGGWLKPGFPRLSPWGTDVLELFCGCHDEVHLEDVGLAKFHNVVSSVLLWRFFAFLLFSTLADILCSSFLVFFQPSIF